MIGWEAEKIAAICGARLLENPHARGDSGPTRAVIDSRQVAPGELFIGLPGERTNGGTYAAQTLQRGAWGVLVQSQHSQELKGSGEGVVLEHPDPLTAMQTLARVWREELQAKVVGITGSTGKTSTKDILFALLDLQRRTVRSPENHNTEIGLALAILAAPADTEILVLEMAMRGPGQIAELTEIAKPDVGIITNIGPVHLEMLGSIEAIAAAKAELIEGLAPGASIILPAGEALLESHLRDDLHTITFGEDGQVRLTERRQDGSVTIEAGNERITLRPSFAQPHNLRNLVAAVAAAQALGITSQGDLEVRFSALRGERLRLADGITVINDCYNANPISMRAAIDDLAQTAPARRVAVLGDMLELGPEELRFHREIAEYAAAQGVDVLVAVGPLAAVMAETFNAEMHTVEDAQAAAQLLTQMLKGNDTVLVKGSRGVGMEHIAAILQASLLTDRPVGGMEPGD